MGFWLIQRGTFNDLSKEYNGLTGRDELIRLDYMGSAEFEFGAIPHAYRRIMGVRKKYIIHKCNDIKDYRGENLYIFCNEDCAEKIESELKRYIEKRYRLQEYSTIHGHLDGKDEFLLKHDFFWCIDQSEIGDWMGWFGNEKTAPFLKIFDKDYNEWWMKKTEEQRLKEYNQSFGW